MTRHFFKILPATGALAPFATPALADTGFGHGGAMMWGMGWMGIVWILVPLALVLGIVAVLRYLPGSDGAGKNRT